MCVIWLNERWNVWVEIVYKGEYNIFKLKWVIKKMILKFKKYISCIFSFMFLLIIFCLYVYWYGYNCWLYIYYKNDKSDVLEMIFFELCI